MSKAFGRRLIAPDVFVENRWGTLLRENWPVRCGSSDLKNLRIEVFKKRDMYVISRAYSILRKTTALLESRSSWNETGAFLGMRLDAEEDENECRILDINASGSARVRNSLVSQPFSDQAINEQRCRMRI